jgi:2-amino-4-hydroxy-6-hydroxymethyldihydropteridine diphosphokinase
MNHAPNTIFILLGSNLGDRMANLSKARTMAEEVGPVLSYSSIHQSAAWGRTDQPDFLNQVITVSTYLEPLELLSKLNQIEAAMGRQRVEKWGPRLIDLDILFYGNQLVNHHRLIIPHPGIPERRFTLAPLAEIAPHHVHPALNKSMTQLLNECTDPLKVTLLS